LTRTDRSAVHHDSRPVKPGHSDDRARHILVASHDGNISIVPLRAHHGFNRICNNFARLQRIFHDMGAIRDAVAHSNAVKYQPYHTALPRTLMNMLVKTV